MTATQVTTTGGTRPWRKRHPVISRSLLYVLGLGLVGALVLLYVDRQADDEAVRRDALAKELDDLSLVHAVDPTGEHVLRLLDEKFSSPDLPVEMRGRALRWRAMAHRKQGNTVRVEAALVAASALDLPPRERAALQVEWAEARVEGGDPRGALDVLPSGQADPDGPLGLLHLHVMAQAHVALGSPRRGVERLAEALRALRPPLGHRTTDYVGGRPWTMSEAATVATELWVRLSDEQLGGEPWNRLRALADGDFDAQKAAARGLIAAGRPADARAAWARARALDPDLAEAEERNDQALARLATAGG